MIQSTVDMLRAMKMTAMATELERQASDVAYRELNTEERISLIVNAEWNRRQSNKITRLINAAHFAQGNATMEGIEYFEDRKLDKALLLRLSTGKYMENGRHIILKGASGNGKTYLACALGNAACRNLKTVRYIRMPELLGALNIAKNSGDLQKLLKAYKKVDLLIIDEWLIRRLTAEESYNLLEIMESRYKRASTILCSQFDLPGWREKLVDPILADAICDRIVHDSYTVIIDGKESMRKRKGLQEP